MAEGNSALKIVGLGCGIVSLAGICGLGSCMMFCGGLGAIAEQGEEIQQQEQAATAATLPWIDTVRANCARYEAAPNEIRKSEVFNENEQFIGGTQLSDVQGTLESMRTSQGGGGLTIKVAVGAATFANGPLDGIGSSSPLYQAAGDLVEDGCVQFSATVRGAASVVERSKVCDLDYYVDWTSVGPCAP